MRGLIVLALCGLPLAALAEGGDSAASSPAPAAVADGSFGSQTRLWLSTQASGTNAVDELRPMPGDVASAVYQRYVTSFTHPIPEELGRQRFVSSGGGGGTP